VSALLAAGHMSAPAAHFLAWLIIIAVIAGLTVGLLKVLRIL
jgi:hypothetical protein